MAQERKVATVTIKYALPNHDLKALAEQSRAFYDAVAKLRAAGLETHETIINDTGATVIGEIVVLGNSDC